MAMLQRPAITTEALQKQFLHIYREFFGKCQRVASASNSFLWTGEFAGFYGGITVSQKLPIRSYVGWEVTHTGEVRVEREYCAYQAIDHSFVTGIVDDRLSVKLTQYLERELKERPDFTGLTLHLLTEIPLGHSLGSHGAIAGALALLLETSTDFDKVFGRAREILALSQAGYSSGVSAYMGLTECSVPVVFFSHNDEYFAKPMDELVDSDGPLVWPIDFGLIYSGGIANAESVILANDQTVNELDESTQKLNQLLDGKQQLNFRQTYLGILNMTSSMIVMALVDLFKQGTRHGLLERLFNSINQYQNLLHILHVSNGATDIIYNRIHQLANKQVNDVGSGVKISGIGRGGGVLFAVPYGAHRTAMLELVEKLQQETGRSIWLDYASWLDGIGGQPGRIDQDIVAGKHSSFIASDALAVRILRQGRLQDEMFTVERFNDCVKELDIILDKTNGKILIAGQTLTSKELPSQKATVAILSDLLQSSALTLKNDELPGTYGTNRYDLQGKIVIPLVKQVKQITGRDLQLTISGGMYDAYQLSLDPSNVAIGVVEKKH